MQSSNQIPPSTVYFRDNDAALLSALRQGNETATAWLYEKNYGAVRAYVLKNSGSDGDVPDLFQDAMVALLLKIRQADFEVFKESSLHAYLVQTARNLWLKRLRDTPKLITFPEEWNKGENSDDEPPVDRWQVVEQELDKLGETCRKVIRLFYFEEKSMTYIANELDWANEQVARNEKRRCLQRLMKAVWRHINVQP